MSRPVLRFVLVLTGLGLAAVGLNTALGGMATLGWQFPPGAVPPGEGLDFARHDNNARFFAGVFVAMGLITAASAFALAPLRLVVIAFMGAIALGGLARLGQGGYSPLADAALLPSVLAEVLLAPGLGYWLWAQGKG